MTLFDKFKSGDPLLLAAKLIVGFAIGIMIFAMVMIGLGLGALATVERAEIIGQLAKVGAPANMAWLVAAALALALGLLFLGVRFMIELFGIMDTVGTGDPFAPENGSRLSRMGWLAIGAQGIALALKGVVKVLEPYAIKAGKPIDLEFDLDMSGVLLVLILFILARVFRHGATMRADLEGTV
ncbi:MAG: DUF2975 domain-containing protein [Sphingomonadaceae bacterium]|jgi:Protein of unknown function (DUF2975)|nr:DUF2975 domain-containing protein [Sphingomonadaceae bacterium]